MRKRINLVWGLVLALSLSAIDPCLQAWQSADQSYQAFLKNPSKTKYHQNWENQAKKFERIALNYPNCEKADDAWLRLGKLWLECYKISKSRADQESALSAFSELVKRYPKSSLADDALLYKGEIYLSRGDKEFAQEEFSRIIASYTSSDCAPKAKDYLNKLGVSVPSPSSSDRVFSSQSESEKQSYIPEKAPLRSNDAIALLLEKANTVSPETGVSLAEVNMIRYWSAPSYTRVVVDLSQKAEFTTPRLLQPDPALGAPPRIFFDILKVKLSPEFRNNFEYKNNCYEMTIGDGLLRRARVGQYKPDVVRVVLDMESITDFQTLSLPGERGTWRIVIDTFGEKKPEPSTPRVPAPQPQPAPSPAPQPAPAPSPTPQPAPSPAPTPKPVSKPAPPVIVIDAGHGGKDPGAIGKKKSQEKVIALNIAKYLEMELKKQIPDAKIILTRRDDRFLTLEERTAKANAVEADLTPEQIALFVSIHCNASPDRSAFGIETYYLDNTTDRAALKLAAAENFVSLEVMEQYGSDVNKILADMATTSKVSQSIPLAHSIQKTLVKHLSRNYSGIKDLGVKKAPFWVLTGARLPCVLIETGFISNATEEKRLSSTDYQKELARGIAEGIKDWVRNPQANLIP